MSFFEDASLVLIPSAQKTSKVYSVKPTDGTGDLTFTRSNDTATRVGPDGLIEKVRTNLILQSQAFNTTWTSVSASVTANTTANPLNGAVDADTITLTGATTQKYVTQSFSLNGNYTASVYLKAGTHQFAQIMLGTDTAPIANFDLTNGTSSATNSTAKIVSVGGGWYRCSMSFTSTTGNTVFILAVDSLAASRFATTASTGTLIAFGYQLETGDVATPYIATTTAAVSVGPVANVPRLDYLNSSCPRLILEGQRTNVVLFSEQFNNAAYSSLTAGSATAAIVTANFATSPDGYQNADRLQFSRTGTTSSDLSLLLQNAIVLSATGTATIYLKSNTSSTQNVLLYWGGGQGIVFAVTPEWQRFTLPNLAAGTDTILIGTRGGSGSFFNGGDLTLDVLAYGFQIEAGAYATSYIPTLGAAVTRGADACNKTGISSLIGQTAGTIYLEVDYSLPSGAGGASARFQLSDGTTNEWIIVSYPDAGTSAPRFYLDNGGSDTNVTSSANMVQGTNKIAAAYQNGDYVLYLNGVQVGASSASIGVPSTSRIDMQGNLPTDPAVVQGAFKQALLFKTRLSNADLAALTA